MRHRLLSACRPSASDAFLARRAAAGDDDAFEKLYARYQPRLQAYCRSIVRHDEDARDAVQNAMTKALVALRRQDGTTNVGGWLFRIAHNEAISLLRRRRPTAELPDVMQDRQLGPAADFLLREELRATLAGVRALPPNLQHPLLLRELAGLSYGQVAEVVGGTPAAARKAVFDARTALSADRAGRDEACSVIRQSLSEGDGRRRRARLVRSHLQSCHAVASGSATQRQRRCTSPRCCRPRRRRRAAGSPACSAARRVAAGVSGGLATNAKVAASLAVIAAGAVPVVERVERSQPAPAKRETARAQTARRRRAASQRAGGASTTLPPPRPRVATTTTRKRSAALRDDGGAAARRRARAAAADAARERERAARSGPPATATGAAGGDGAACDRRPQRPRCDASAAAEPPPFSRCSRPPAAIGAADAVSATASTAFAQPDRCAGDARRHARRRPPRPSTPRASSGWTRHAG